jgi:hypothetical protein
LSGVDRACDDGGRVGCDGLVERDLGLSKLSIIGIDPECGGQSCISIHKHHAEIAQQFDGGLELADIGGDRVPVCGKLSPYHIVVGELEVESAVGAGQHGNGDIGLVVQFGLSDEHTRDGGADAIGDGGGCAKCTACASRQHIPAVAGVLDVFRSNEHRSRGGKGGAICNRKGCLYGRGDGRAQRAYATYWGSGRVQRGACYRSWVQYESHGYTRYTSVRKKGKESRCIAVVRPKNEIKGRCVFIATLLNISYI